MERRTVLKLVAAGVLPGAQGLVQLGCSRESYRPEFLTSGEFALLDALTEIILPADDHSPGARAAMVARYIDVVVADGGEALQHRWRSGLTALSELAQEHCGDRFEECSAGEQDGIVAALAANEGDPRTDAEQFFVLVKEATIRGYYTSETGIREELGYAGNSAIDDFPGCTHPVHG